MEERIKKELVLQALNIRKNSYSPYSCFCVGAALLTEGGRIYTAVNMENASYPAGICAEAAAFAKAISEGERSFSAIAIAGGKEGEECFPCGICRQIMAEHCRGDLTVIIIRSPEDYRELKLEQLLPFGFRLEK